MKAYESCLYPLLQELYERIQNNEYSCLNINLDILPAHLSKFLNSLKQDSNSESIILAVKTALVEAESCDLCYNCQKCIHQFYLSIAKLIIPDFFETNFSEQKQMLECQFGKISFRKAPTYLNQHFDTHVDLWKNYLQSKERNQYQREIDNKLIILKGMSSSSPYIYNEVYANHSFTGGGFYLKYKGFGIAIDPGYGFVENMRKNRINIQDINAVIITHFHIDHTNDMRLIGDLNHQFQDKEHIIQWYMDETTYEEYYHGFEESINVCKVIKNPRVENEININENIVFSPFSTEHILVKNHEGEYDTNTFGFVLTLKETVDQLIKIGYTSDTRYFENLETNLNGSNIVIANISSVYYEDYLLVRQKDKHLGYRGCYYLLQNLDPTPELFVVSEFWSGTTDLRFDVCKSLNNETKKHCKIIPSDVGLHIDFIKNRIKCSRCGKYKDTSSVFSIKPNTDFDTIEYVCKDCLL